MSQPPRPPWFRMVRPMAPAAPTPGPPRPATTQPPPAPAPTPRPVIIRPTLPLARAPPIRPQQPPPSPPPPPPPRPAAAPPATPPPPAAAPPPPSPPPRSPAAPRSPAPQPAAPPSPSRSPAAPKSPAAQPAAPPSPSSSPAAPKSPAAQPAAPKSPAAQPAAPPPPSTAPLDEAPPPSPHDKSSDAKSPLAYSPGPNPAPQPSSKPSSPAPKSPSIKASISPEPKYNATAQNGTVMSQAHTPVSSPKVVKPSERSPVPSPESRTISHPPSPLTLPPAQIKSDDDKHKTMIPEAAEQKRVVVQEPITQQTRSSPNTHNHNSNGIVSRAERETKNDKAAEKTKPKEVRGMTVVTLAGENKGAIMELSPSSKKHYKSAKSDSESVEEGRSNNKKEQTKKAVAMQSQAPMNAFMNSNVQGVNNSILYNCNFNQNDPGVHLSFSRKAVHHHNEDHHG